MSKKPTLKTSLMVMFLAAACFPLLISGAFLLRLSGAAIERQIAEGNLQTAETAANEASRFFRDSRLILEQVRDELSDQEPFPGHSPEQRLELLHRYGPFESMKVVDSDERIIMFSPFLKDSLGDDLSNLPFLREAMESGRPAWSPAYLSTRTGYPSAGLAIASPFGAILGELDLTVLQEIIQGIKISGDGYAAITDCNGTIIAHSDRDLILTKGNPNGLAAIQEGPNENKGAYGYRLACLGGWRSVVRISETGWFVTIVQPKGASFGPMGRMRIFLLGGVGITMLTILSFAFFGLKSALAPISNLVAESRKIARGEYPVQPVPTGYAELHALADRFMSMARAVEDREKALRQSQESYRDLVERSFDGIFVQKGARIVFANQRLGEMLGYAQAELLGLDHWMLYHGECQDLMKERALARMRGDRLAPQQEVKLQHKDGSWLYGACFSKRIDMEGEPGLQVWIRDISEHKRVEEGLSISERRFKSLYDSVSDLIYTQDLEGRFLTANRALAELFGYPEEEFIGRRAADFMRPELRHLFDAEYLATLKKTRRHQGVTAYFTKDGRKIYLDYVSRLLQPESGEAFISGIARDVTERVAAQRAIQEREQRLQAFLDATPNPLVVYDPEGRPLFLNPAFTSLFGWTMDDLKGKKIPFVPDNQREKTISSIKALYNGENTGALETKRLTRDGHTLDVVVHAALIKGVRDRPSGMVVSFTDLTESKRMKESLLQAQKMEAIGLLAGGVAHDFNNLLMAIQGNISLMLMNLNPEHPFFRRFKDIEQCSRQGAELTRQLLGFARGGKYEIKPVDFTMLLRMHNQIFGRTRKGIRIQERYEDDLWLIEADEGQMLQVLMNLYLNASEAMPEGGTISVDTRNVVLDKNHGRAFAIEPGRYVQVQVMDTGIGMTPEIQERMFDPFFTTKETGRGSGMGLASVYGIVKNHGGFIEVQSEVGKGSVFQIHLPAADPKAMDHAAAAPGSETGTTEGAGIQRGQGTILLVDDEELVREVGGEMLGVMGYRVYTTASAQEALALFERNRDQIDLVVLDMIMPDMGGGPLFDRLKAMHPKVRVLLSSGYSMDGQARAILERGCKGFIQKPFGLEELSQKVREILA